MMFRQILLFVLFLKWTQQCLGNVCAPSEGTACLWSSNYCSGSYYTGSTCVDGYCRCANNPHRDYCTCLAISGECRIEQYSSSAVGTPTFEGQSQTTYSCKADENCDYDVHVISNYEGDYNHGFGPVTRSGRTNVHLRVTGQSSKPLVLVFVSYEPVNWILNIDFPGRVVSKVLLGSYYLEQSDVTYSSGSVLNVERHSYQTLPCGYGSDTGGCKTDKILKYVVGRFGPVASFSGSYRADAWTLNIHQVNTTVTDCPNVTTTAVPTTAVPTTTVPTTTVPTTTVPTTVSTISDNACAPSESTACIGSGNYCPGSYYTGSTCVDGYCRCANNPHRDYCTCLVISGECRIEQDSSSAVGTPRFEGQSQTTLYSCKADENCNYDVHVVSNYEGDYNHGFGPVTRSGRTNVHLRVTGQSSKPLVLVFVSYEPVNWILNIDFPGRVVSKVLLGSYYLEQSDVTYSSGSVLDVERHSYQTLPCGYGSDTGGCKTDKILEYVVGRFGPVASFSGSYRADAWTLNIHQVNTTDCPDVTTLPYAPFSPSQPFMPSQPFSFPPQSDSSSNVAASDRAIAIGTSICACLVCFCLMLCTFVCCYISDKKKNSYSSPQNVNVIGNRQFIQPVAPGQSHVPTQQNQSHFRCQFQQKTNFVSDHSALPDARDPQGVLMDSAPPAYDAAINFPSPQAAALQMDSYKYSSTEKPSLGSISDNPPPYSG